MISKKQLMLLLLEKVMENMKLMKIKNILNLHIKNKIVLISLIKQVLYQLMVKNILLNRELVF